MATVEKFTLQNVSDLCKGCDLSEVKRLDLNNKGIKNISDLSSCAALERLDLSHNCLRSVKGIVNCLSLTWLSVAHNSLKSLGNLHCLVNLVVLNASHNSISVCGDISSLRNLKALILNNNKISSIQGLGSLRQLNTLVLSSNQFETIDVGRLSRLEKLSLSHNMLKEVPDTTKNKKLKELRANGNRIDSIPQGMEHNTNLQLCDVGNNRIGCWESVSALPKLKGLRSLNLKGNGLCGEPDYPEKVASLCPWVVILDGHRQDMVSPASVPTAEDRQPPKKKLKEDRIIDQIAEATETTGKHVVPPVVKRRKNKKRAFDPKETEKKDQISMMDHHLMESPDLMEDGELVSTQDSQSSIYGDKRYPHKGNRKTGSSTPADTVHGQALQLSHYPHLSHHHHAPDQDTTTVRGSLLTGEVGHLAESEETDKKRKPSKPRHGKSGVVRIKHVHKHRVPSQDTLKTLLSEAPAHMFGGGNVPSW